jgi:hypothetical protein
MSQNNTNIVLQKQVNNEVIVAFKQQGNSASWQA